MTMHNADDQDSRSESPNDDVQARLERAAWMGNEDAMSLAVHKVYCGIMADHEHPSEKDREQARQLLAALGQLV